MWSRASIKVWTFGIGFPPDKNSKLHASRIGSITGPRPGLKQEMAAIEAVQSHSEAYQNIFLRQAWKSSHILWFSSNLLTSSNVNSCELKASIQSPSFHFWFPLAKGGLPCFNVPVNLHDLQILLHKKYFVTEDQDQDILFQMGKTFSPKTRFQGTQNNTWDTFNCEWRMG